MQCIDNLRFVFFTHENNFHLLELTLKYFFKHNNIKGIKVSVISNKIPNINLPFSDQVEYLDGNEEFNPYGAHFSKSLKNTLSLVKEDYIFLFCDDYFFIRDTKWDDLEKLLNLIQDENIDYFGFDDIAGEEVYTWPQFSSSHSPFPSNYFYIRDNNYRYLHSVQPTIWNKNSLINLVNKFDFSLHGLDETLPLIKNNNNLKCLAKDNNLKCCLSITNFLLEGSELDDLDYFVIAYCEIVRHGVFYHPLNGFGIDRKLLVCQLIDAIISDENLLNNNKFKKLINNIE